VNILHLESKLVKLYLRSFVVELPDAVAMLPGIELFVRTQNPPIILLSLPVHHLDQTRQDAIISRVRSRYFCMVAELAI